MAYLYGISATAPTRLDCTLAHGSAQRDHGNGVGRGRRNADGWGLARWMGPVPEIVRSTQPVFANREVASEAESTRSRVTLAHVRTATIGGVLPENVHPFDHGPWALAHNGTLTAHCQLASLLAARAHRAPRGSTDSELIFQWLLGRMPEFGLSPNEPSPDAAALAHFLKRGVLDLVRSSIATSGVGPPKLNLLLSDGVNLVASRWGNSLYWTFRNARPDCARCGRDHSPEADDSYRAVVVASQPVNGERWPEVQEGTILAVGPDADLTTLDLLTRAA